MLAGLCRLAACNLLVAVVGRLWEGDGGILVVPMGNCKDEGEGARLIPIPENSRLVTDI